METTLSQILDAREQRVQRQRQLLDRYQKPLLCFTMNIPGPEKLDRDVVIGFFVGNRLLQDSLPRGSILHKEEHLKPTGCEAFYVVDMDPVELKRLAVDLEETDPIGRLFDMDVIDPEGNKTDREKLGLPRRKCLLCDKDAVLCASRRAHSLEELRDRTGFLLYLTARQYLCEFIAAQAYLALHQEVATTPKPGLVDRHNRGAHQDMDIRHFFASAAALRPYFCRFAEEGFLTRDLDPEEAFRRIRPIGVEAESAMRKATHGVNTHKGAIFSLGLLCAATGRLPPDCWQSSRLLAECAAMTRGLVARDFAGITKDTAKTTGERLFAEYGITGVRGQAEAGFPALRDVGIPIMDKALDKGLSLNDAGCVTLLHLITAADDTNLIHRSNRQTQLEIKAMLSALLEKDPFPSLGTIDTLDREFIEKNLSPGGSADLLALTYFLHFLK